MTLYHISNNTVSIADNYGNNFVDIIPPHTYKVEASMAGFYLSRISDFDLPKKLYGDVNSLSDKVFTTFLSRSNTTGVWLDGFKGCGKTLLAKKIAIDAQQKYKMPVIVVGSPYSGASFNTFIQAIDQPCILLFDEFEKIFDKNDQIGLLTLLDGVFSSKKLFLLTSNDHRAVNEFMVNRPGRIFYKFRYSGLGIDFIKDYLEDNLLDEIKGFTNEIINVSSLFREFSFDMLAAVVEECNRYKERPTEAIKHMNLEMNIEYRSYVCYIEKNGIRLYTNYGTDPFDSQVDFSIFDKTFEFEHINTSYSKDLINKHFEKADKITEEDLADTDGKGLWVNVHFDVEKDLKTYDMNKGVVVFEKDNYKCVLTRGYTTKFDALTLL